MKNTYEFSVRVLIVTITMLVSLLATALAQAGPAEVFGPLFSAVQNQRVFADSKTFADAEPRDTPTAILKRFASEKPVSADQLRAFVARNFRLPEDTRPTGLRNHIRALWSPLTRPPSGASKANGSSIALPAAYVVPGGRFREMYYWDSYFTMLGLKADHREELVDTMMQNFTGLVERYGMIPNGTRTYYLSRSQPPFFAAMMALAPPGDRTTELRRLKALRAEHRFWTRGESCIGKDNACEHVVRMPDGSLLNRYWDAKDSPRDESYAEDMATAAHGTRPVRDTYRDLRAAAESGWDFSSRWLAESNDLSTIRTTQIIPIDLNSLLWQLERAIAERCARVDRSCARPFAMRADARRAAITRYLWDSAGGRFADWDRDTRKPTPVISAATLYPLFVGLASRDQGRSVAATVRAQLVAPGGLRTTLTRTSQQWDAPNGWAPLQWIAVDGLARYGEHAAAREIARRWIATVDRNFRESGKLLEKYNIEQHQPGGGGEYPLQDGFGWTNGVASALLERYPELDPDRHD